MNRIIPLGIYLILSACTTGPQPSYTVPLYQLLDQPTFAPPPLTEENAASTGFQKTFTQFHSYVDSWHQPLTFWVRECLNAGIAPQISGRDFVWRIWNEPGSYFVSLTVTPGDTVSFFMDHRERHASAPNYYHYGRVIPRLHSGILWTLGGIWVHGWGPVDGGHRLQILEESCDWSGLSFTVVDSTEGGGYLMKKEGLSLLFEAHWDRLGHGTWWSRNDGEGSW